jgi:L-alanine-DL-glutamate epimerase-like enolase superfamily enzyme
MINRRQFLGSAVALTATGCAALNKDASGQGSTMTKIDRVDLFPMRYPMTGYFKFFTGPHGSAGRAAVIVKMTTDDGTVGWGQALPIAKWSYETLETVTIVLRDYYAPVLIGRDPTDIAGAHAAMNDAVAPGFTTGMPITRAGVDLALHDLKGKLRNEPVAALWGRSSEEAVELSWTVNVQKLEEAPALMEKGRERGYRHFNIKVGPDPAFDRKLARTVRDHAPDCFLWADANGGYDEKSALEAAPLLADEGVNVLEAPLRPNHISGYQKLKQQNALPILMDEGVISPRDAEEFARAGMMDGIAMKPQRCGGLMSNKAQIEICEKRDMMWLGSGLTDPDISLAATLHLYSAYGLSKPAALNGRQFLTEQVLKAPVRIENGQAHPPQGPGLGVEVDEDKVIAMMKDSDGDKLLKTAK